MKTTRRAFGALLASGFVAGSGCLGFASGSEPLRFEAVGATPSEEAVSEAGYEHQRTETRTITREFEAAGQTRSVEAVNVIAEYDKRIDLGPLGHQRAGVFVVFATPRIDVLGRSFNPVEDMDHRELANEVQSNFGEISIDDRVGQRTITVSGKETDLSKFTGMATLDSQNVEIFVHLGTVETDEDVLVLLGIYPRILGGEEETIVALAESVSPRTGA